MMGLGVHHSALDEWSIPTLHRDMVTAYRARTYGSAPTWSESPTQYADYAVWQRRLLGTVDDETSLLAEQLRYWTAALDEVPAVSGIPSDRIRPTDPTWSGRWREAVVPDVVVSMLREVARQQGVSMFMLTQAAVALAVSASGGGDDVVLGSPVGGRTDEALTDLVGYFVNTLPLRYDLTGNPTPADLLARVRATVLAGFENQETPFEEMVRAVGVERSGSASPLFQTMVTYREDGGPPDEFAPGIGFGSMDRISLNTLKSEAELYITVAADEITVVGGYSDELFSDSTVRRFTDTLMRAFEILATDVNTALAQVDLLTDRDRSRLHTCSRGTRVPEILSGTGTLDSLLATQAASTPDSVAIVFGDTTLTYAEFDARVNGLTRLLLARGVRVGDRVAVVLPRGEWLPIALSAIVRSGAAYVPVDPSYPMERIDHLLSDSTPTAVITGRLSVGDELAGRLDHVPGRPEQIDLDDQTALREIAAMSDHPVTDHERCCPMTPPT
ncbi:hypothetical protein BFL43_09625 [Williamsia sp. 1135]|nr:hypothetical protein BFL43_09625 [Williamsia sp. 1135]